MQEQYKDTLNINEQNVACDTSQHCKCPSCFGGLGSHTYNLLPTLPHVFEACEDLKTLLDKYKEVHPTHPLAEGKYPYRNRNKNIIHIFC